MQKLSDAQWKKMESLLPKPKNSRGGRPRLHNRRIVEGILWVLFNGGKWSRMPDKFGSYVTVWRRFKEWEESGLWSKLWLAYLHSLSEKERLAWTIAFLQGNFIPTKQGSGNS